MLNLATIAPFLQKQGIYGPVTATLDWCEINHQFSPYIAEMANTLSNLFTITVALVGYYEAKLQLPKRYGMGYLGLALVGLGSFFFHATLLFEAQLADELPMIYVGSINLFLLFDTKQGFGFNNARSKGVFVGLVLFDALFTWSYVVNRNPIYHQVVFATIILTTAARVAYILKRTDAANRIPPQKRTDIARTFTTGAVLFAVGFGIWNLDNIFCGTFTEWKLVVGWPLAFFLEGHSWWHVLTCLGAYYMLIGIEFVSLCVKDNPKNYQVEKKWGIPHIRRTNLKTS